MRLLKRVLVFAAEVAVLIAGIVVSFLLAVYLDSSENQFAAIAPLNGLFLTVAGFLLLRRKTRAWKIEQAAASWMANRSWRQLHPQRVRHLRMAQHGLLCLPSICAAFALFFLPVASHLVQIGTKLVPHYQVFIPWNWIIIRSRGADPFVWVFFSGEGAARYGLTPIWFTHSLPSAATFATSEPASAFQWRRPEAELARGRTTHTAKTEFSVGMITMTCWEYRDTYHLATDPSLSLLDPPVLWEILCSTQPNGVDFNLHATFLGRSEDIPAFYKFLKEATAAP